MNYRHARRAVILDYFGELAPAEKEKLASHLQACRRCAADRDEILRMFALFEATPPESAPAPRSERVWNRIKARLAPGKAPVRRRAWAASQWSLAGAALVLVLAAGIFVGRSLLTPPAPVDLTAETAGAFRPAPGMRSVLAGHLEDLKPLLLEYANCLPETGSGRMAAVEEKLLRALILQNILLRDVLAKADPEAAELLDDCDLILKEILNQNRPTSASLGEIRDLIRERDVLFKLEIIKKI